MANKKLTEELLRSALERIRAGKPINPQLIQAKKNGKLKITLSSVALEAGVSKSLLGSSTTKYPQIRELIQNLSTLPRMEDRINLLKQEIQCLKQQIAQRDSMYAELVVRTRAYERGLLPKSEASVKLLDPNSRLHIVGIETHE